MNDFVEITIVGGGVIGLSTAWELATRGHQVRVVDSSSFGRGATWAGAGILPPSASNPSAASEPIDQLRAISHRLYPEWTKRIHEASGIDAEFSKCGGLYLGRTGGERATLLAQQSQWRDLGIDFEQMSLKELGDREPSLKQFVSDLQTKEPDTVLWHLPDECTLRNPRLVQGLVRCCERAGVEMFSECKLEHIEYENDSSICMQSGHGHWRSKIVCITTGAWTQLLMNQFELQTGILPVRGQMLLYKLPTKLFSPIINDGHRYVVPRRDGHVLAGSCEEEVGFDASTTEEMIEELKQWVEGLWPGWNDQYFVQAWAGLRPGSFDGLPYVSRFPNFENMIIAAGHFRSGLHLAPATARIVADLAENKTPEMDIAPFHLNRGRTIFSHSSLR